MVAGYSVSPDGEKFYLPGPDDYGEEAKRLEAMVNDQRALGREIVVVMGVGFVGAAMAAVVADTEAENGEPSKFVIGMQRPSHRSYWKIPLLNRGVAPVKSEDPELEPMIARCVNEKKNLVAEHPVKAAVLETMMDMKLQAGAARGTAVEVELDHELEENLRALGYLE